MKGLVQKRDSGVIYLGIKYGSICEESKKERNGFEFIEGTTTNGKPYSKWIRRYDRVEALINKIEYREWTFEEQPYVNWALHLDAAGTSCVLEFPFSSKISSRFMNLAENLDFNKPVEFSAWKDQNDKTAFSVRQDDQNVPQKYTRENPGNRPEPIKRAGGKWSYDDQNDFLYGQMVNIVIPKVDAAAAGRAMQQPESGPTAEPADDDWNDEDPAF